MKITIISLIALFAAACSGNNIYPQTASDCPAGTTYKTNPSWADEVNPPDPNAYRWCG